MRISSFSLGFSPLEVRLYIWRGSALSSNNEVKHVKAHLLPSLLCVLSFARYNVTLSMDNDWGRMCGEFGLFLTFCPVTRTYWRWVTVTGASVSILSVYTLQLVRFVWLRHPKSSFFRRFALLLLNGAEHWLKILHWFFMMGYFEFEWVCIERVMPMNGILLRRRF